VPKRLYKKKNRASALGSNKYEIGSSILVGQGYGQRPIWHQQRQVWQHSHHWMKREIKRWKRRIDKKIKKEDEHCRYRILTEVDS